MKIIHCLNHFFPGQIAGTEVYTLSLIKELQKKNIECTVLIPNSRKNITEQYEVKGVRVIKYAEPSVADRELLMGKRKPDGLAAFTNVLKKDRRLSFIFMNSLQAMGLRSIISVLQRKWVLKLL